MINFIFISVHAHFYVMFRACVHAAHAKKYTQMPNPAAQESRYANAANLNTPNFANMPQGSVWGD